METPGRSRGQEDCVTPQMRMDLRKELQQAINRRNNLTTRSKLKAIKFLETSIEEEEEKTDATDFDRRNQLRRKAIEEILSSEKSYLTQLEKLMTFFVNPLKSLNLLEMSAQSQLFGQLELIYNINQELLMRLENDLDDVANAFLKLAPFFKIYSVFAFDYRNSMILLQVSGCVRNEPHQFSHRRSHFLFFFVEFDDQKHAVQELPRKDRVKAGSAAEAQFAPHCADPESAALPAPPAAGPALHEPRRQRLQNHSGIRKAN
jgi:hypothetical protein